MQCVGGNNPMLRLCSMDQDDWEVFGELMKSWLGGDIYGGYSIKKGTTRGETFKVVKPFPYSPFLLLGTNALPSVRKVELMNKLIAGNTKSKDDRYGMGEIKMDLTNAQRMNWMQTATAKVVGKMNGLGYVRHFHQVMELVHPAAFHADKYTPYLKQFSSLKATGDPTDSFIAYVQDAVHAFKREKNNNVLLDDVAGDSENEDKVAATQSVKDMFAALPLESQNTSVLSFPPSINHPKAVRDVRTCVQLCFDVLVDGATLLKHPYRLVVADVPYGLTGQAWDIAWTSSDLITCLRTVASIILPVTTNRVAPESANYTFVCFCSSQQFPGFQEVLLRHFTFVSHCIWVKAGTSAGQGVQFVYEYILIGHMDYRDGMTDSNGATLQTEQNSFYYDDSRYRVNTWHCATPALYKGAVTKTTVNP